MPAPVAYGIHAVRVMLARSPQRVRRVLVTSGREAGRLGELKSLAERAGVQVTPADDALLDKLAEGGRHQGVVAEIATRAVDPETQLGDRPAAAPTRRPAGDRSSRPLAPPSPALSHPPAAALPRGARRS